MIRLTLNPHSDPEIHLFNKSTILIGSDFEQVDLVLPGANVQPIHLKIIEQNGSLVLVNDANDPFASVNGYPFGKKLLNSGDVIALLQTTLLFESLHPSHQEGTKEEIESAASLSTSLFSFPFEQDVPSLSEEELKKIPLDDYLKEIESTPKASKPLSSATDKKNVKVKKTKSLKDDYLKELDDDAQSEKAGSFWHLKESSHLYQAWKWILVFIFSLFTVSAVIGTILYFSVSDKKEAQETKAAQAVADIAMALTHAQLNHSRPHNQNWSDIDFLKINLQAILPDTHSYAHQLNAQGQFNSCPYSLRIYTSRDLSHFLLIAQPAPSLLNWLIPQSLIIVDSNLMELRTLKDARNLNRLLSNPDPLDSVNGKEITSVVKEGRLIHLAELAADTGQLDFSPPQNIASIEPEAENLIHNSPRYYRLGHSIVEKAMLLSKFKSDQEASTLKQDIENFNWLNHFIFYSDQGKKSALLARQQIIASTPPDKRILFGYLLFNAQGRIYQVHLLKDEEEIQDSALAYFATDQENIALQGQTEGIENHPTQPIEHLTVDTYHPIYIQLQSIMIKRENELAPLAAHLSHLVNQELHYPNSQFEKEFQELSQAYLEVNAKYHQTIKETLKNLYDEYEDLPHAQFSAFIKALNLEQSITSPASEKQEKG